MRAVDHKRYCVENGWTYEISATGNIAAAGSLYVMGRVNGRGTELHNFFLVTDRTPYKVELFEAPTVTGDGTPLAPRNKNRNVADSETTTEVFSGTTVSADGTLLYTIEETFSGTGSHVQGGDTVFTNEWILKENTDYVFKITNTDGATALNASFGFTWCEVG